MDYPLLEETEFVQDPVFLGCLYVQSFEMTRAVSLYKALLVFILSFLVLFLVLVRICSVQILLDIVQGGQVRADICAHTF